MIPTGNLIVGIIFGLIGIMWITMEKNSQKRWNK